MDRPEATEIHALFLKWNPDSADGLGQLTESVYDELRRLARSLLSRERPGHTMSATDLVHEVYLRLAGQQPAGWENRAHFFGAAANIMRRVLVDHAKKKFSQKRGGQARRAQAGFQDAADALQVASEEVLLLDTALERLGRFDPRKVRVVEMKFFAGMTNKEIALALRISDATVERDWQMARAWLIRALNSGG